MKRHAPIAIIAALLTWTGAAMADQKLAQGKACMSCHQMERKVIGPAMKDIANKYKGDTKAEAHLTEVIQKGGKGVWGTVPMPPQPMVKPDDAKTLAEWILSL